MLEPVSVYLHSRGIIFHRYLDDILFRCQSRALCLEWTLVTAPPVCPGFRSRSPEIGPRPFSDIGFLFLTHLGIMRSPEDRIANIQEMARWITSGPQSARSWLSFLGLLGSAEKQVPFGRLHIRPLQTCLRQLYRAELHLLAHLVVTDDEAIQVFNWWTDLKNLRAGQPLGSFQTDFLLHTDASKASWGAHFLGFQAFGYWTFDESCLSSLSNFCLSRGLSVFALHLGQIGRCWSSWTTRLRWLTSTTKGEPGP